MGDKKETTTSGLNNKALNTAVTGIGTGLTDAMKSGVDVYNKPIYTGLSGTTTSGINSLTNAAKAGAGGLGDAYGWAQGVVDNGGYNSALKSAQGGIQNYLKESQANAPGYAQLRQNVANDTLGGVNASFLSGGRFGSSVHTDKATESLGNVLAGMDYQNYTDRLGRMLGGNQALAGIGQTAMGNAAGAASAIPGLYGATLMPGQAQIGAGQILDADSLAKRQAEAAHFDATKNQDWNTLARATQILGGTAPAAGTTTTQSQQVPWWQSAGSLALGGLSLFG